MDCPTCFQKIVAPQAPADGAKLILTGTKFAEKKAPAFVPESSVRVEKTFPAGAAFGLVLLALTAGAAGYYFYGKKPAPEIQPAKVVTTTSAKLEKIVVAPPANSANWSLTLNTNAIPETPVAGRIHGQDFVIERAFFQSGQLTLRAGTHGTVEFGAFVHFGGAQPESLAGQTIKVSADADKAAKVSLRFKDDSGAVQKPVFENGYALRLEFGALGNNRLPGKIYLCTPDAEKSYLLGSFNATIVKPKPNKKK